MEQYMSNKKIQMISEDEKQIIRAARKVLEKLVKRYAKLRKRAAYINCKHCKMYKELTKLKVDVDINSCEYEESVQLSLNSGMYGYSTELF